MAHVVVLWCAFCSVSQYVTCHCPLMCLLQCVTICHMSLSFSCLLHLTGPNAVVNEPVGAIVAPILCVVYLQPTGTVSMTTRRGSWCTRGPWEGRRVGMTLWPTTTLMNTSRPPQSGQMSASPSRSTCQVHIYDETLPHAHTVTASKWIDVAFSPTTHPQSLFHTQALTCLFYITCEWYRTLDV